MPIESGSVKFCTIYDDEHGFSPNYIQSLMPSIGVDLAGAQRLARGGWMFKHAKGYDIAQARNEAVGEFLNGDAEWLWFIDSDMGWEPEALERLVAAADPVERPIVGGLCFGYSPVESGMGEANGPYRYPFPTLYDLRESEDGDVGFRIRWGYRPSSIQKVDATGAAFLLIHRDALEAMKAKHGETWFTRIKHPQARSMWGEDTSFCVRAADTGFPVYVHGAVRTSHLKPVYVSEALYFTDLQAPPADVEIDVIVPVLGRPHHAAPFMRSLRASTGLARALAVASHDDDETIDAWREAGAEVLVCEPGRTTFAHKANDGFRATSRPWLCLVGSDVHFHPGWWDHALQTARLHGAAVVATNDMLNYEVRDGRGATHPVMLRSYVTELGASWDGPGVVAHEGYHHNYVDHEWTDVAVTRGLFTLSMAAKIEHLHPAVGKAEPDEVYKISSRYNSLDRERYQRRIKKYAKELVA